MLKCLKQWSLYTEGSSAPKVFTRIIESTGLEKTFKIKSYHPIHIIFSLCACPHSLNCMHFPKSDMFSPLASTTIPKLGKGYKIWRMYCCFKSSTLASYQQEKLFHSNLPREPPSCTYLASSSTWLQQGIPFAAPLAEDWLTATSPTECQFKFCFPSFDTKKFPPSLIARETLSIMLKLPSSHSALTF